MLAQEAAFQLGLRRVLLIPTGRAPHKRIEPEPGPEVRLELTRAAALDNELFEVSEIEVEADRPSFTLLTLEDLAQERAADEFVLLMGADVAAGLESWHEPRRVLERARIGVAARPGTVIDEAEAALERLDAAERFEIVRMPEIGVSSTRIRRRVARGRPIRYLVPDAVAAMIEERGLYRGAAQV